MEVKNISSKKIQFASDNYAGICPEAMEAINEANKGYAKAYGEDEWTQIASDKIREFFDIDCEVFFVFNGTAANSLAISSLCQSYHSVICHELAHIETDECGGPEFFSNGTKILLVPGENGKINIDAVEKTITKRTDIHYPKPKVLSITQPTEVETIYTVEELRKIQEIVRKYNLKLHMDGARFFNVLVSLNVHPSEITWKVGVDVLCFGGTKIGMPYGEAIVFFNKELAYEFDYRCKQAGQLASKMRFIAAPWIKMLETGAWFKYAKNANEKAKLLEKKLNEIPEIEIMYPCQANSIFVNFPEKVENELRNRGWYFYDFIGSGFSRLMCSWSTKQEDVELFINEVKDIITKLRNEDKNE